MAREFDGSSQYIYNAGAVLTALPCTLAAWIYPDSATVDGSVISICKNAGNGFLSLNARGTAAGDPIQAHSQSDGAGNAIAATTVGYSTGSWQHACAVFASSTSRAAYLNGTNKGTDTTAGGTITLQRTAVGVRYLSTPSWYFDGRIAVPCVWNVALSDDEVAQLAAGFHPLLVRPDAIVALWNLDQGGSPEQDDWGGYPLTLSGAPTQVEDPPLIYPWMGDAVYTPAGASVAKPVLFHAHYMSQGMRP